MQTLVTRTYLEMSSPGDHRPARRPDPAPLVAPAPQCPASLYRSLYEQVGRAFRWTDRLTWSDRAITDHLATPGVWLWLATWKASPAGYFELRRHDDESVELAYFGLLPGFHGRGWGSYLLTEAVQAAWQEGPGRVWLHTCTFDHPAAFPNYLLRGFRPFRRETYSAEVQEIGVNRAVK